MQDEGEVPAERLMIHAIFEVPTLYFRGGLNIKDSLDKWEGGSKPRQCDGNLLMKLVEDMLPLLHCIVSASLRRAAKQNELHGNCLYMALVLDPFQNKTPFFQYHIILEIVANLLMRPESVVLIAQGLTLFQGRPGGKGIYIYIYIYKVQISKDAFLGEKKRLRQDTRAPQNWKF